MLEYRSKATDQDGCVNAGALSIIAYIGFDDDPGAQCLAYLITSPSALATSR